MSQETKEVKKEIEKPPFKVDNYKNLESKSIPNMAATLETISKSSEVIDEISNKLVNYYCGELDEYMFTIDKRVRSGKNPATDDELELFTLNLPVLLYFAGEGLESLGVQEDIARAVRQEKYNGAYDYADGTVAARTAFAELQVQEETLVNIAYQRAYKKVRQKIDAGNEMLNSIKKVLTKRAIEMELSRKIND